MTASSYKAVILSPHLDDAAFSCAGEIARLVTTGEVLVLNVFTRFENNGHGAAVVLGPERYQEEEAASRILGFKSLNLGNLDAFFRHKRFRSIANIFRPLHPEDLHDLAPLVAQLNEVLSRITFEQLYVPLAIGWHVDHVLTHLAALNLPYRDKLVFYEDAPYCHILGLTPARLYQLRSFPATSEEAPHAVRLWRTIIQSFWNNGMMRNFGLLPLRILAYPAVCVYFARLLHGQANANYTIPLSELVSEIRDVSATSHLKESAILAYTSQVKALFGDAEDMRYQYQQYSLQLSTTGTAFERYWRLPH